MKKVKCVNCGDIGYTAAPRQVKCSECGGRHRVIKTRMVEEPGFERENAFLISLMNQTVEKRR